MTEADVPEEPSIAKAIALGVEQLDTVSDSPRLDAELLLMRAIDVARSYLIAHPEDQLDPAAWQRFTEALEQRRQGKPMAYITGEKEFWSMPLMVSPATLVPRPDTEVLVEQALGFISRREPTRVLDLGTGSGAIALAIARDRPLAEVVATDLSIDALAIARENARQFDIDNVSFVAGNWLEPVGDKEFDVIVSNPPYVREDDPALDRLRFEPQDALISGPDGLDDIRRIAADALGVAAAGGWLLVEHGADQGESVADLFTAAGWQDVRTVKDLAGLDRVTLGRAPDA